MKTTITKEIEIELPELPEPKNGYKWELRGLGWKSEKACIFAFVWMYEDHKEWDVILDKKPTNANKQCFYAELVRTHRGDGTPLDIEPLPEMPDNVERVEYFGEAMSHKGDADNYICINPKSSFGWEGIESVTKGLKDTPSGAKGCYYARVWYKKENPAPTEPLPVIDGWRFDISKGKWGMTKEEMKDFKSDGIIDIFGLNDKWSGIQSLDRICGSVPNLFYVPAYKTNQKTRLQDLIGEDYQGRAYIVMMNDYWINFHPAKSCNSLGFEDARYGINQNTRWSHSPFTKFEDANPFVF